MAITQPTECEGVLIPDPGLTKSRIPQDSDLPESPVDAGPDSTQRQSAQARPQTVGTEPIPKPTPRAPASSIGAQNHFTPKLVSTHNFS